MRPRGGMFHAKMGCTDSEKGGSGAALKGCIRNGARGHFFDTVNLAEALKAEAWNEREGRLTEQLTRLTHHCEIVETGNENWRFRRCSKG